MSAAPHRRSLCLPFVIGVFLGILAKLVDVPSVTCRFSIFDDIMVRFGIWVFVAAFLAVHSKSPLFAALRSFIFFVGMLSAYYGYTILYLKFFPRSQIILWSSIAVITPFCGFFIWQIHKNSWYAYLTASLPLVLFFTEWYITAEGDQLLMIAYSGMTLAWLAVIPDNKKRFFSLLSGVLLSIILTVLIQMGIVMNFYELLLNI